MVFINIEKPGNTMVSALHLIKYDVVKIEDDNTQKFVEHNNW